MVSILETVITSTRVGAGVWCKSGLGCIVPPFYFPFVIKSYKKLEMSSIHIGQNTSQDLISSAHQVPLFSYYP